MSPFQVVASVLIVGLLSGLVGYLIGRTKADKPTTKSEQLYRWKGPAPPIHPHCRCVIEPEGDSDN